MWFMTQSHWALDRLLPLSPLTIPPPIRTCPSTTTASTLTVALDRRLGPKESVRPPTDYRCDSNSMLSFVLLISILATDALLPPRTTENHAAQTKQPQPTTLTIPGGVTPCTDRRVQITFSRKKRKPPVHCFACSHTIVTCTRKPKKNLYFAIPCRSTTLTHEWKLAARASACPKSTPSGEFTRSDNWLDPAMHVAP
jgi:hypothetical protein